MDDTDIPNDAVMSAGGITPPVGVSAVVAAGGITPPAPAGEASVAARDGAAFGVNDVAAVKTTLGRGDGACGVAAPPGPPETVTGVSAPVSTLLWRVLSFDSVDRITQSPCSTAVSASATLMCALAHFLTAREINIVGDLRVSERPPRIVK